MKLIKRFLFIGLMFFAVNMSAQSVYVTKTGEKYHKITCPFLKYSKKEITYAKALDIRFTACSVCKPNVKVSSVGLGPRPHLQNQVITRNALIMQLLPNALGKQMRENVVSEYQKVTMDDVINNNFHALSKRR